MDDIDRELINLLGTKIGMLMEDHGDLALTLGSKPEDEHADSLAKLDQAAQKISAMVTAARSIAE